MVVGQSNAILEMVAAGFGISVFPGWAIRTLQTYAITVRPITRAGFPVTWRAAFLNNRQIPIFEQEFINIVSKLDFREPAAAVQPAG